MIVSWLDATGICVNEPARFDVVLTSTLNLTTPSGYVVGTRHLAIQTYFPAAACIFGRYVTFRFGGFGIWA